MKYISEFYNNLNNSKKEDSNNSKIIKVDEKKWFYILEKTIDNRYDELDDPDISYEYCLFNKKSDWIIYESENKWQVIEFFNYVVYNDILLEDLILNEIKNCKIIDK